MGIKDVIQNRKLASIKRIKHNGRWRPGENPLQLVGFILCMEDVSEIIALKKVQSFFTDHGAVCRTCIYLKNEKMEIPEELIDENIILLDRKSVNWYGLLRAGFAEAFIDESFDLMINFSKGYFFTTSYLASVTKASLKIGRYEWPHSSYRIVLNVDQSGDVDVFINLLKSSLQIIKFE